MSLFSGPGKGEDSGRKKVRMWAAGVPGFCISDNAESPVEGLADDEGP